MGFIANALKGGSGTTSVPMWLPMGGQGGGGTGFLNFARKGYMGNEIVYSAIRLLATSAAEPKVMGRNWTSERARQRVRAMALQGMPSQMLNSVAVMNRLATELPNHPLVTLLNNPNPFMNRVLFKSTIYGDWELAGNAYILKARSPLGNVAELWRLRPDRVRIRPSKTEYIEGYEYKVGQETQFFPARDVIHWRKDQVVDDYYGEPSLMAISERLDIDNYMRSFLSKFFSNGGTGPGAILSLKGQMKPENKQEIRDHMRRLFSGPSGWFETLILDNSEGSTYTRLGLDRGLGAALPKEINGVSESRIAMALGIPGSILGTLIGYESSSYANKKADWRVFWDIKMRPDFEHLDAVLNQALVPDFGGIDEIFHDLSGVAALQDEQEVIQERAGRNFERGLWTREEARTFTGMPAEGEGTFFMPANMQVVGDDGLPLAGGGPEGAETGGGGGHEGEIAAVSLTAAIRAARGRPTRGEDETAREVWVKAQRLRAEYPGMTTVQVASRVGVSERTLRRYEGEFGR